MFRWGLNLLIISVLLMTSARKAHASYVTQPNTSAILLVGITGDELADQERKVLTNKRVIEIPYSDTWQKSIVNNQANEVILKQNTGFVGLYTPAGFLVRPLETQEGNPYFKNNPQTPVAQRIGHQLEYQRYGYSTGGRIDPYQPKADYYEPRDNMRLAAGYGYNTHIDQPKTQKRTVIGDLFNFVPIDVVTPFNYPGTYDQLGISSAYTLGVLPHIGGAVAAVRRAKGDKANYDYYKQQYPPDHADMPPVYDYYNPAEPTNPITTNPNFMRSESMPQSFQRDYPNYGNNGQ